MKKSLAVIMAVLVSISTINSLSIATNEEKLKPEEAIFERVAVLQIGSGEHEVAYTPDIEGIANDGPASFAIDNQGDIYILDTLNKKVLILKDGKWDKNIDISFTNYARDILIEEKRLFVLDESNFIYELDINGSLENSIKLPDGLEAYQIVRTYINKNKNIVISDGNSEYEFFGKWNQNSPNITFEYKNNGKSVCIDKDGKYLSNISFEEETGGVNIINNDSQENVYLEVIEDVPNSSLVLLESTLRMIDKNGKQVGIARIPLEEYYNYPLKFYNVTDKGEVYIMALKKDCVEIDRIILGKSYQSKMKDLKIRASQENEKFQNATDETAQLALRSDPGIPTRSLVQSRANAMIDYNWTYNSTNTIKPSTDVTTPDYLSIVTSIPQNFTGIPYCWGGFDGVDRSSNSGQWSNYQDAMSKGKFAGNVYCSGGWKSGTAGLDCSGFASAAYGFTIKYGTSSFASMGTLKTTPLYMDYYVKAGEHILLFKSNKDTTTINSQEATTSGDDKTKNYTRTKLWLSTNGYSLRSFW